MESSNTDQEFITGGGDHGGRLPMALDLERSFN